VGGANLITLRMSLHFVRVAGVEPWSREPLNTVNVPSQPPKTAHGRF
jgi:hypothetical protein